jgi:HD-GYP domain-containing protein (c-di-GMP phosphodiesterase class II)
VNKRRISMQDMVLGEPLQWDVFDTTGHLLLSRGHVIDNNHLLESLVARGMFIDLPHKPTETPQAAAQVRELPSVLRFINLAHKRLEGLLFGLHAETDAQAKILEVAKTVIYATNLNPDIAIACILLNQSVSSYAGRHSMDTALVSLLVAQVMNKSPDEVRIIVAAALTMNIGMIRQHDHFQDKQGPLIEKEIEFIKKHPEEGVQLLKQAGIDHPDWLTYVLQHHENEDGSGYPHGLRGQEISQNAKIISLADRYCARITGRTYRQPLLPPAALRGLFVEESKTIDTHLAPYFIHELGTYPPGTYVRLQNGEIGVATRKGKQASTPIVHALVGPRGVPLSFPIQRDSAKELFAIREAVYPEQADVRFSMQQLWGKEASL